MAPLFANNCVCFLFVFWGVGVSTRRNVSSHSILIHIHTHTHTHHIDIDKHTQHRTTNAELQRANQNLVDGFWSIFGRPHLVARGRLSLSIENGVSALSEHKHSAFQRAFQQMSATDRPLVCVCACVCVCVCEAEVTRGAEGEVCAHVHIHRSSVSVYTGRHDTILYDTTRHSTARHDMT
jgi:hypothetical protein